MIYFGLFLLLAASLIDTALGQSMLFTGWTQKFNNAPYPDLTAQVGDTITFIWTIDEIQNVFIHPTNNCSQTGRIAIGNVSPTEYTFKPEDAAPGGKRIFFSNDIADRCENYGMRLVVTVFPNSDSAEVPVTLDPPTNAPIFTQPPVIPTSPPIAPTDFPVFPTFPPVAPTFPPVAPTFPPVAPTLAPVFPTAPPVVPTNAPAFPTDAPIFPTFTPTQAPTLPPTQEPSAIPTKAPTVSPTISTTTSTGVPTQIITVAQTNSPIESSEGSLQRTMLRGLQMTLSGIESFSDTTKETWRKETEAFSSSYFESDRGGTFRTSIAVTNSLVSSNGRRLMRDSERSLQTVGVTITYNQVISYSETDDAELTDEYLAKSPFATADQRSNYVDLLQNSNDPVLEVVTDSSPVTFANEVVPETAPDKDSAPSKPEVDTKNQGLSMAAIIGIACGGGALIIIAILFCIYCRVKKAKDKSRENSNPPPKNVSIKPDEVSTLAGPSINQQPYGDRSIGTVDYDYSKAYGDRDHSVSYAGGTLGSDTQDLSFPANALATGAALGPYDDDGSYGDHYRNSKAKVKEEILNIFAPPGKLGVVIDTPDDGAPVVHAVKETSVVVDKVKVGDKLVAVDDEDVRTLTAIKVSKLISRKSANPSRKLTILRITRIE